MLCKFPSVQKLVKPHAFLQDAYYLVRKTEYSIGHNVNYIETVQWRKRLSSTSGGGKTRELHEKEWD